jgi:hypothetical protein
LTVPALIITYSRLQGLVNLLDSCRDAGVNKLYIAIDGAVTKEAALIQESMVQVINEYKSESNIDIQVWHREKNLGITVSVITAIDWFFRHESQGVILEDDLILSNIFFTYMAKALSKFEADNSVSIVSGNRYDGGVSARPVLVSFPQTWGWATWREKWALMRIDFSSRPIGRINQGSRNIKEFWQVGADRVWDGYIDTWDLLLAHWMLVNNKKCLLPPVNLVSNIGVDSFSTHTKNDNFSLGYPVINAPYSLDGIFDNTLLSSSESDNFLTKNVFHIRRRHYFLNLYRKFVEMKMQRKYTSGSLGNRLSSVNIP